MSAPPPSSLTGSSGWPAFAHAADGHQGPGFSTVAIPEESRMTRHRHSAGPVVTLERLAELWLAA
jgi:hypothetical protein